MDPISYFCPNKKTLNYLAHIFLSGKDSQLQIGNFIGDFVKGSNYNSYPEAIRKGILLHRKIDSYTDNHTVVKQTVAFLRPTFGRYSAIITDMYFDYFLAIHFSDYHSKKSLKVFALSFYSTAILHYYYLPFKVKSFIFHFILTDRLSKYSKLEGLKSSLQIMAKHKIPALKPEEIINFLIENHVDMEQRFHLFFPDLIKYVKNQD